VPHSHELNQTLYRPSCLDVQQVPPPDESILNTKLCLNLAQRPMVWNHDVTHKTGSTEPRPHETCTENLVNFGRVISKIYVRHTDRHTCTWQHYANVHWMHVESVVYSCYSPTGKVGSIVMSMSVCLSVRPLAYLKNHTAERHQIFAHVAFGCGSVLLRRRWDTVCTSGFVDDVMQSNNGPMARHVYS